MDEPTPEQMEVARRWLETENGKKYFETYKRVQTSIGEQKQIINEALSWFRGPEQNNDASYTLIGKFIVKFSHLEILLRIVFGVESRVQSSLQETLMMTFDFALLVSTLKSYYEDRLEKNKPLQKKMKTALNACLDVNSDRVKVAHGAWILKDANIAALLHLKRGALSSDIHFEKEEQLSILVEKTDKVCAQFASVLFEVLEYEAEADE